MTRAATGSAARAAGIGLRSDRGPVVLSLMLSTSLVALDSTIIATAIPSIVDDLGGFTQFPWLFSIYLLAQAVSVPIYGKLADLVGRKPIMLLGIGLFLVGSILCGFAWNMTALIVFRAIQGLGAGAVQPMSITIAGDIYTLTERARAQGYLASVWGMSAVVGPALGGLFAEHLSWRWIFLVNIPLCLLAGWMLLRRFEEKVTRVRRSIDYVGAVTLTLGSALIILGLLEGGQAWAWTSPTSITVLTVGVLAVAAFVLVERKAAEPVLPLWVLRRRVLVAASLVSLLVGAVLLGLTTYVPTFAQDVLGATPVVAGFALATLTIGWPIAASLSGRLYLRCGFRVTAMIGSVLVVAGAAVSITWSVGTSLWSLAIGCFVVGLGMGLVASPSLIAAQSSVGWGERGVVTATSMFARSIGSAVGVAAFGAIVNAGITPSPTGPELAAATHGVFVAGAALAVVMAVAVLLLPGGRPDSDEEQVAGHAGHSAAADATA